MFLVESVNLKAVCIFIGAEGGYYVLLDTFLESTLVDILSCNALLLSSN